MPRRDGYVLLPVSAFPGLNLRQQPRVGALDLFNVAFLDVGGVRNRDGYRRFGTVDFGAPIKSLGRFRSVSGQRRILVSQTAALKAVDENGTVTHTAAGGAAPAAAMTSYSRVGLPGAERVYMANGVDTTRRFDLASGFSAPTARVLNAVTGVTTSGLAMPKSFSVANWAAEARTVYAGFDLANAGPNGLLSNHDTVWISEPGDPEYFRDSSAIVLSPGDGTRCWGALSWRDQVFVFKEDKFFVLSQVVLDGSVPRFSRRGIDASVGPCGPRAMAAGREAVYFVGRKGLYATNGAEPLLLSGDLDALWGEAPLPPFYTGGRLDPAYLQDVQVECVGDYLYIAYRGEGASRQNRLLVYHTRQQWFSLYSIGAACMVVFRATNRDELYFARPDVNVLMRHGEGIIGDDNQPFDSYWLGAYDELAGGRVVRIRQQAVYGNGEVYVGLACDYKPVGAVVEVNLVSSSDLWNDGTDATDLWGDGTILTDLWGAGSGLGFRLARRSYRAAHAALYIGDHPNDIAHQRAWQVHRVVKHIAGGRAVSVLAGKET